MSKIDLKNYFEKNLSEIKEFKFLKEFYDTHLKQIIQRNNEILDKLSEKLLAIIVILEGDYNINENVFSFLFQIIEALIENTKRKIGYIILMNPILEYFLNVIKIQKDNKNSDEKNILFNKEKDLLLEKLDFLLEKNFSKAKSTPYLLELIELYNEDNKNNPNKQINNFWINSFINGNEDILSKISKFYSIDEINISNLIEKLELIKNKIKYNN
jgi:hypothetical protein